MGHAEVAETPGHAGDEADEAGGLRRRGVREERLKVRIDLVQGIDRRGEAARVADDDRRDEHDGDEHERSLDEIRPAHGHVAAHQRVADDDGGADPKAERIAADAAEGLDGLGNAEGRREELRAAHEPGGRVEREEDEDDQRRDDAGDARPVAEAVADEVGNGDRVLARLRIAAEALGYDLPVEVGSDQEPDADPRLRKAADVNRAGKAHEKPARHVGGLGGEGYDPFVHPAPAEIVVAERLLALREEVANPQHHREIARERTQHRPVQHVITFSSCTSRCPCPCGSRRSHYRADARREGCSSPA